MTSKEEIYVVLELIRGSQCGCTGVSGHILIIFLSEEEDLQVECWSQVAIVKSKTKVEARFGNR